MAYGSLVYNHFNTKLIVSFLHFAHSLTIVYSEKYSNSICYFVLLLRVNLTLYMRFGYTLLTHMDEKLASYPPYEAPTLTVDGVLFQIIDGRLQVLLVERKRDPFAGAYALPGVYVPKDETTRQAFDRALHTKAGIESSQLDFVRQLYAADTIARDPRGHAVSIVYIGLGNSVTPATSPETETPQFYPVDELPQLAFDHAEIIATVKEYLKTEAMHTNVLFALLPKEFTLTQLQVAYEVVLGHQLDKRNFRKKLTALDLVEPTNGLQKDGAHRPARLYRFTHATLTDSTQTFA